MTLFEFFRHVAHVWIIFMYCFLGLVCVRFVNSQGLITGKGPFSTFCRIMVYLFWPFVIGGWGIVHFVFWLCDEL